MKTMLTNELYGSYRNRTYNEIFPNFDVFEEEYNNSQLVNMSNLVQDLYYLLYAKYGNSPIANADENQFKYRLFGIMYSYGPTWEKKIDIQKQIRELTLEELTAGSKAIYNNALNPGTAPSTQSLEELPYINAQNTTNYKRSKIEALTSQLSTLEDTVTEEFLSKFKPLFMSFVSPELPLLYGEQ